MKSLIDPVKELFKDEQSAYDFYNQLCNLLTPAQVEQAWEALFNSQPTISIRLNPAKPLNGESYSIIREAQQENNRVAWSSFGYYLQERPNFTNDPTLHAGAYYVQEPSSMFLEVIKPLITSQERSTSAPQKILDLCAAPGGKSTLLISIMGNNSSFTANEVIKSRVAPLRENILKWGNHNVQVTNKDSKEIASYCQYSGEYYHFVLVDAPCSGEGMFRKERAAVKEWSLENVALSAARQRRILADIWPAIKPGGYLLYTTCTFNPNENDKNSEWLKESFGAEVVNLEPLIVEHYNSLNPQRQKEYCAREIIEEWGVLQTSGGGYRFIPGFVKGEGLYFILFQKPGEAQSNQPKPQRRERGTKAAQKSNLTTPPTPEGAHSLEPNQSYPHYELTFEEAQLYLRAQSFSLAKEAPLGYITLTYCGLPLGYGKNIGSRLNNLYPKGWRILK